MAGIDKKQLKMQKTIFCLVVAVVIVSLGHTPICAETVIWAVADRPTSYILSGPDKGRGVVDEVYALLHRQLTDDDHKTEAMNFARILYNMEQGKHQCACGFKKPEREEVGYFSIPAIIALPYSVVTRADQFPSAMKEINILSLETLLNNRDFKGGITKQRSYGSITAMVNDYENRGSFFVHSSTTGLIKMLLTDRVDYIIEIPSFVKYVAKQTGDEEKIESFAISENTNQVLIAYIFCTNNTWGRTMIEKINTIILKEIPSEHYLEILERWYDKRSRGIIREYYNHYFLGKLQ